MPSTSRRNALTMRAWTASLAFVTATHALRALIACGGNDSRGVLWRNRKARAGCLDPRLDGPLFRMKGRGIARSGDKLVLVKNVCEKFTSIVLLSYSDLHDKKRLYLSNW